MKKILAITLALATILSATLMTVSAADTDEVYVDAEYVVNVFEEELGYRPSYRVDKWYEGHFDLVVDFAHKTDLPLFSWEVDSLNGHWTISKEEFEKTFQNMKESGEFSGVPFLKGSTYKVQDSLCVFDEDASFVIYGEAVECEWLPVAQGATVVEIFSDVESEEFLSIVEVSKLFYEEFDYDVRVTKCGNYFDAFLVEDLHAAKEFLIPVKEEGLPSEVWEAFVVEFEDEFNYDVSYLNELGVQVYFAELLGYKTEVSVFRWGEDDVTIDVTFDHLGGKTYCLEAIYVEEYNEYCVTDVALEAFLDRHPECSVVPNFTWKQLMKLLEFYYKW
jgi:hypothetical protein